MAANTPTARQRPREATRGRILEAAVEVFAEKVFAGVSTREIARPAGTHQGLDPRRAEAVETHADFVAGMLALQAKGGRSSRRPGSEPMAIRESRARRATERTTLRP